MFMDTMYIHVQLMVVSHATLHKLEVSDVDMVGGTRWTGHLD